MRRRSGRFLILGVPEGRDDLLPLKRHAAPEEIATAVVYLASDESAFMTAQRLRWTVASLDK